MTYKCTPDWSHVTERDVSKFYSEVERLAKRRFGLDVDGDCPIQVLVINKTREQSIHFGAIEHTHEVAGEEKRRAILRNLRTAQANVAIAAEQLRCVAYAVSEQLNVKTE